MNLSYGQRALWYIQKIDPSCHAYNLSVILYAPDDLNLSALRMAFEGLARQQPALRTIFRQESGGGEPIRCVLDAPKIDYEISSEIRDASDVKTRVIRDNLTPLDIENGAPLRVRIFQHGDKTSSIVFSMHHLNIDGLSIALFIEQLKRNYLLCLNGAAIDHLTPKSSYDEFVESQIKFVQSEKGNKQFDYWRERLSGELPNLNLPLDKTRPLMQSYVGSSVNLELDARVTAAIRQFSKSIGLTPYTVLLAVFKLTLHVFTGQDDLVVGTPNSNRDNDGMSDLIGYLVNMMALRSNIATNSSVRDFLQSLNNTVLDAKDNGSYPFPLLVEKLKVQRDASRSPIFQACFSLISFDGFERWIRSQAKADGAADTSRLRWIHVKQDQQEGQFDLFMEVLEDKDRYAISFHYCSAIFNHPTIESFSETYNHILAQTISTPDIKIKDLDLVVEKQKERLLGFNSTDAEYPSHSTILELFDKIVDQFGDRAAVVYDNRTLSYRELNDKVRAVAARLIQAGVKKGDVVALRMKPSLETIVAMLAALRAGAPYLPIDTGFPVDRVEYILKDSRARFLLLNHPTDAKFDGVALDLRNLNNFELPEPNFKWPSSTPDDLAYIAYTSGTTGKPKGTQIEQKSLINYSCCIQRRYGINEATVSALLTSYAYGLGYTTLWVTLLAGGTHHMVAEDTVRDLFSLLGYLKGNKISFIKVTPSLLNAIVNSTEFIQGDYCSTLKDICCGGEKIIAMDLKLYLDKYPSATIWNHCGSTETTIGVMTCPVRKETVESFSQRPVAGPPNANVRFFVANSSLRLVPIGAPGELLVSGPCLARGYLGQPELTAEKFINSPFEDGKRVYRTGDLVRWHANGTIEFLGRSDRQVKVRGFRVELTEIEKIISGIDGVSRVVVVESKNQSLCAYVVMAHSNAVNMRSLKEKLSTILPDYMVPSFIIELAEIPVTANGKIDMRALPEPTVPTNETTAEEPETHLQRSLTEIWGKALRLNAKSIGINRTFFDLGGHSLLVFDVVSKIRNLWGITTPIALIYNGGTIKSLATYLEAAIKSSGALAKDNLIPLAPAQVGDALTTKDLLKEATLTNDFDSVNVASQAARAAGLKSNLNEKSTHLFITGANGYLGAHLIHRLLMSTVGGITCLVRAQNVEEGRRKISDSMKQYALDCGDRLQTLDIVCGDLGKQNLGLSKTIHSRILKDVDVIVHLGAWVNHLFAFDDLKKINVDGTREILNMASRGKIKKVVYLSTLAIGARLEADTIDHGKYLCMGYVQGKWVGEKLMEVAEGQGLPTTVIRPGLITWNQQTGASNSAQYECIFLRTCIELGLIPNNDALKQLIPRITPVDVFTSSLQKAVFAGRENGRVFHLVTPKRADWPAMIRKIQESGYSLKQVPYKEWRAAAKACADGGANILQGLVMTEGRFSAIESEKRLNGSMEAPVTSPLYLENQETNVTSSIKVWLGKMHESGFLVVNESKAKIGQGR